MLMKAQKQVCGLLTLLFVAILSFSLTSCGGDDDNDDTPKIVSPIVGTWQTVPYIETAHGNVHFSSYGTYILSLTTSSGTSTFKGAYEVTEGDDGIIKLYDSKGNGMDFWEYKVSSNGESMVTNSMVSSTSLTWKKQ